MEILLALIRMRRTATNSLGHLARDSLLTKKKNGMTLRFALLRFVRFSSYSPYHRQIYEIYFTGANYSDGKALFNNLQSFSPLHPENSRTQKNFRQSA